LAARCRTPSWGWPSTRGRRAARISFTFIWTASAKARDFLASGAFDRQWRSLTFRGKPVRVRLIPSDDPVLAVDPFDVVREDLGADGKIADRGVFLGYVRPLQGQAGFVVVDEPVDKAGGANGHASDFLDRGCKLGRAQPGR
jgi:CDP-diacylglycerol pyrophosphatase